MIQGTTTYRVVTDQLGSPRLIVNTADGSVIQRMDYDEFGDVILDTNPGFQPFGFAGGLYDRQTKLVRFGFRDLDPSTGRWSTRDPLGFAGSINAYAYLDEDPLNGTDPSGLVQFAWYHNLTDDPTLNSWWEEGKSSSAATSRTGARASTAVGCLLSP